MAQHANATDRPELVFGLVGAVGVRLDDLGAELREALTAFGYRVVSIRLSTLLADFTGWTELNGSTEADRIRHLQDMGDALRRCLKDGAALARAAITRIRTERATLSGNPDHPASACAYILHQLKHPDEVELLRQVYGQSFLLLAGHAPWESRAAALAKRMARHESRPGHETHFMPDAYNVMEIDDKQDDSFGQNTRDTYPRADFFANLGISRGEYEVRRFVDLLFGHPFATPSPEEYAMYLASAVSLRSSDDSRQVGAVIVSLTRNPKDRNRITNADVVAVGMNEVPRGGGGFYWDHDSPDHRDQALLRDYGEDRAKEIKVSALAELIGRIRTKGWLSTSVPAARDSELAQGLINDLKRTQFMDIGEFGRTVHAEMAAIIDGARRGVALNGYTMYVTTFPCHNCAKHIIAAGIRKVVFLEPYAKSRAKHLHEEEMISESADGAEEDGKVIFVPFAGIGPRQYQQVFAMSERGARKGYPVREWEGNRQRLSPRYVRQHAHLAYLCAERQELMRLPAEVYHWNMDAVCPTVQ